MKQRIKDEPENTIRETESTLHNFKQPQSIGVNEALGEDVFVGQVRIPANEGRLLTYLVHSGGGISNVLLSGNVKTSNSVTVSGDHVFVARDDGLTIVNKQNPDALFTVSTFEVTDMSGSQFVAIQGNYAYVTARWEQQMTVVDISDIENPSIEGIISGLNDIFNIIVDGDYVYMTGDSTTDSDPALVIVNVSDPANPTLEGQLTVGDIGRKSYVRKKDKHVFISSGWDGLFHSVDVSDPTNPTVSDVRNDTEDNVTPSPFDIKGNYAMGPIIGDGFGVLDISDPNNMEQVAAYYNDNLSTPRNMIGSSSSVVVLNDKAFTAQNDIITEYDVSDPTSPFLTNIYGNARLDVGKTHIDIAGDYIFANGEGSELGKDSISAMFVGSGGEAMMVPEFNIQSPPGTGYPGGNSANDLYVEWWYDQFDSEDFRDQLDDSSLALAIAFKNRTGSAIDAQVNIFPQVTSFVGTAALIGFDHI